MPDLKLLMSPNFQISLSMINTLRFLLLLEENPSLILTVRIDDFQNCN